MVLVGRSVCVDRCIVVLPPLLLVGLGSLISPELEQALLSIKGVVIAFEKDVRNDVKWDWTTDRMPSALVRSSMARCCV